jgi:hypothetical protein
LESSLLDDGKAYFNIQTATAYLTATENAAIFVTTSGGSLGGAFAGL